MLKRTSNSLAKLSSLASVESCRNTICEDILGLRAQNAEERLTFLSVTMYYSDSVVHRATSKMKNNCFASNQLKKIEANRRRSSLIEQLRIKTKSVLAK